jgi:hypothetical protein
MTVRMFLDLSTAHLSPAALAWLSVCANENHAANYHGTGGGAPISTLGATLHGYFMHAPDLPESDGLDNGIPEDMHAIIRHAKANGCHYILFDADGDVIEGLPVFDEED